MIALRVGQTRYNAALLLLLVATLVLACSGDDSTAPAPLPITPQELQIVSGDNQEAPSGGDLAAPCTCVS